MDDDDIVNIDVLILRFYCGGAGGSGIFRGWLILCMCGFPHSKPDSAASIKPHNYYEECSLYPILQRLCATS